VKSLLRRAQAEGVAQGAITIAEPAERDLALLLDAFDATLVEAYDKRAPNLIADHAFRLAQSFSKFYAACPVLTAESAELKASRLALAELSLRQLELSLDLLGLAAPERM